MFTSQEQARSLISTPKSSQRKPREGNGPLFVQLVGWPLVVSTHAVLGRVFYPRALGELYCTCIPRKTTCIHLTAECFLRQWCKYHESQKDFVFWLRVNMWEDLSRPVHTKHYSGNITRTARRHPNLENTRTPVVLAHACTYINACTCMIHERMRAGCPPYVAPRTVGQLKKGTDGGTTEPSFAHQHTRLQQKGGWVATYCCSTRVFVLSPHVRCAHIRRQLVSGFVFSSFYNLSFFNVAQKPCCYCAR